MESSFQSIPPEIWLQILTLAARHPAREEFSIKAETQDAFPPSSYYPNIAMSSKEEYRLIKQRLPLTLVCKSWHSIATVLLWSHVRLILGENSNSIVSITRTLQQKPFMIPLVKRLTVRARTAPFIGRKNHEAENESNLCKLLDMLTCLMAISYPSTYEVTSHVTQIETISIYSGRHIRSREPRSHFAGHKHLSYTTRILSLDLDNIMVPFIHGVSFPFLEALHLDLVYHYYSVYSLLLWDMPRLRWLSLKSEDAMICRKVILSTMETLEHLRIDLRASSAQVLTSPKAHFPHLASVFISARHGSPSGENTLRTLTRSIEAPQLRNIGFYEIHPGYPSSGQLIGYVNHAINGFPSIEVVYLEGHMKLVGKGGLLSMEHIRKWCEKGLQVKVRSGIPWTTFTVNDLDTVG